MWQNHHYCACKTTLHRPLCLYLLFLSSSFPLVVHRNIIQRFYSSAPFSEKRDLHLFVRFIHVTFSRPRRADLHLFIRMFMATAFFNLFFVSLRCYSFFFIHTTRHCRNVYYTGSRTKHLIDIVAYHAIIFFFFPITAKRLLLHRQNIVANIFMQRKIVYFQRYALPSLLSRNIHSLLMDLSSPVLKILPCIYAA